MKLCFQFVSILALLPLSLATPSPVVKGCNHDNVLRAFLNPTRSVEAVQFCYAYIGATPGPGGFTATVNSTVTSVVTEVTTATQTTYDVVTTTATKTLLCPAAPAGPTSTKICGIEAYTTQENVILAQPVPFPEDCKQLCLSDPICQSFQIQELVAGGFSFCKSYNTSVDRNIANSDLRGQFTLWDRNCFELSPSGCSPFPSPSFPTPTPPPSNTSATSGPEEIPSTLTTAPTSPGTSPTTTPAPVEDFCPPPFAENLLCGTPGYSFQQSDIISLLELSPLLCHVACLRDMDCWSYQILSGQVPCQLNRISIDSSITPDQDGSVYFDRNCRENLPDVCFDPEPTPTQTPVVTPSPSPAEPKPTPDPFSIELCPPPFSVNIFCGLGAYSVEDEDIIGRVFGNPLECHIACLRDLDCQSYQIGTGTGYCQLQKFSIDPDKTPDRPQTLNYDRNCPQNLPDVCLESEEPEVTPTPATLSPGVTPTPTPTPEPVAPACNVQGNAPSGQLIDIIPATSPAGCKQACNNILRCLGFSLTSPFQGGCGLWSVGAKDIYPPATSGQYFYDKECEVPGTTAPPPGETPKPTCNPSPSLICHLEGARSNIVGLIDSAPVESFGDCKEYCAVEPDCLSFSIDPDNRCNLWALALSVGASSTPGGGTFFYDKTCASDAPAPEILLPCTTPAPKLRKRQVAVPSYIPVTVPASRITSACACLVRMPGYTPTGGAIVVTQTIFDNTTITRTTTFGTLQTDALTVTATAFNTARP